MRLRRINPTLLCKLSLNQETLMNDGMRPNPVAVNAQDALLIVDVQNDFLPNGNLAVPKGDEVISILNAYIRLFDQHHLTIIATRDWHPTDHCSFSARGGIW